ncbi:MAG: hypothetical protein RLZZ127_2821, partial [Planctomycetota bacterium]
MSGPLRVAVVGLGVMGREHATLLRDGRVPGAALAAVCDGQAAARAAWPGVPGFADAAALAASGACDAAVIATPHRDHPVSGMALLSAGIPCLVEKPFAVDPVAARGFLAAWRGLGPQRPVLAVNHMQRSDPRHEALYGLVAGGGLGRIQRAHWTITDWYRPDAYYRSSPWRGTWAGEGGGLLVNQLPHQFDLICWLLGEPVAVTARCGFGAHHPVAVEDDVQAIIECASGAVATL